MVKVIYSRDENRLTVEGHAKSAEYGKDLICSAVSTLAMTLRANVNYLSQYGYVTDPVTKLEEGYAEISCEPLKEYKESVRQIFMSVCVGFEMLATEYPDYISYEMPVW